MKNLLCCWILLSLLSACNDKYEALYESAPDPSIRFQRDTLQIREKDPTNINASNRGLLLIYAAPAGHQFNLSFSDTSGKIHFSYRGQLIPDAQPFVVTDEVNALYCYADAPGIYAVDFYLTDQLGKVATSKLIVDCSPAKKPIAVLTWDIAQHADGNILYQFNAAGSRQPYGAIDSYHFLINGNPIVVNRSMLKYFFHEAGQQQVDLFVVDDLGQSSDTLHYSIQTP